MKRWAIFLNVLLGLALLPFPDVTAAERLVQQVQVSEDQFESWLFQSTRDEAGCRKHLQAKLSTKIASLTRQFQLTEHQQNKLRLAAQGDIKQFFDLVAKARDFFRENQTDPNAINAIFQEIQPLQQQLMSDFYDEDSYFHKVLLATLKPSQAEAMRESDRQRRAERYRRLVRTWVLEVQGKVPMLSEQRDALIRLLIESARAPTRRSNYDQHVLSYYASQLSAESLEEIFDPAQRKALQRMFQNGAQLKAFLEQQGLLSEDDANPEDRHDEPS